VPGSTFDEQLGNITMAIDQACFVRTIQKQGYVLGSYPLWALTHPQGWSCNDLDVWVTTEEAAFQTLQEYVYFNLPRAMKMSGGRAEIRVRRGCYGSAAESPLSGLGVKRAANRTDVQNLCNFLETLPPVENDRVAADARIYMQATKGAGRFCHRRRFFQSFRADVVITSPAPPAATYISPLPLNVIWWRCPSWSSSPWDIACFFDLDICMFSMQLDNSLSPLIQHRHLTEADIRTGTMNLSDYAWCGVWSDEEQLNRKAARQQLRRLRKYYSRGFTLAKGSANTRNA